ncbi:MAG: DUF4412 domain-containing protein [Bacteroidetes bacterium]|nr:MAG: DUF4412 domain-containing protein [Bacteroidota bacterium]
MKKLLTLIVLSVCVLSIYAQFNGTIHFKKIKDGVESEFTYYVKDDKVRVEEKDSQGNVKGIMLVDLTKESVIAISPQRKLYMDATNKRVQQPVKPKIEKTKNHKKIAGYDCVQWNAYYPQEDAEITYWVTEDRSFDFFDDLLRVLNRKDKIARYFLTAKDIEGCFTMEGIEKSLTDGSEKMKLTVTSVKKEDLDDSLFEVPDGYQKFEK